MINLEQLNFHHLFYFWRVAKIGHLTRAAQEVHTSQSALSAQIKQLEERLSHCLNAKVNALYSPLQADWRFRMRKTFLVWDRKCWGGYKAAARE